MKHPVASFAIVLSLVSMLPACARTPGLTAADASGCQDYPGVQAGCRSEALGALHAGASDGAGVASKQGTPRVREAERAQTSVRTEHAELQRSSEPSGHRNPRPPSPK